MADTQNPSELARETLRQLAMRRVAPTPDNYRALYHEIAGTTAAETFPERSLKAMASGLPRATPEQARFARQLEGAIGEGNWDGIKTTLGDLLNKAAAAPPNWGALIRELLAQIETRHAGVTSAKKREALDHVLAASGTPDVLFPRLQSLTRNWAQGSAAEGSLVDAGSADSAASGAGEPAGPDSRSISMSLENQKTPILDEKIWNAWIDYDGSVLRAYYCSTSGGRAASAADVWFGEQSGNAGPLQPKDLDGKKPLELTGMDDRFVYFQLFWDILFTTTVVYR